MRTLRSTLRMVRPLTMRTAEKVTAVKTAHATPRQSISASGLYRARARPAKAARIARSRSTVKVSVPDTQPAIAIISG